MTEFIEGNKNLCSLVLDKSKIKVLTILVVVAYLISSK